MLTPAKAGEINPAQEAVGASGPAEPQPQAPSPLVALARSMTAPALVVNPFKATRASADASSRGSVTQDLHHSVSGPEKMAEAVDRIFGEKDDVSEDRVAQLSHALSSKAGELSAENNLLRNKEARGHQQALFTLSSTLAAQLAATPSSESRRTSSSGAAQQRQEPLPVMRGVAPSTKEHLDGANSRKRLSKDLLLEQEKLEHAVQEGIAAGIIHANPTDQLSESSSKTLDSLPIEQRIHMLKMLTEVQNHCEGLVKAAKESDEKVLLGLTVNGKQYGIEVSKPVFTAFTGMVATGLTLLITGVSKGCLS